MAVIDADGLYLGLLALPAAAAATSLDGQSDFEIECQARNRRWHADWAQVMWVVDHAVRLNVSERALASYQSMLARVTSSSKATAA
ncbi:hypothetical protein DFJ67_7121 [Asanoa ferruginea]|uniref:Uncharacterized protein n=1 Tax=Asanoa ferruginea TaxID=53367 RepID=A0A3D9ZV35_9ACTN|nr:hypothetical protein [Asanoa ferruginea]REG01048.1 hypothetical protein DFJ67_7121 [Asanoa ferruginea]